MKTSPLNRKALLAVLITLIWSTLLHAQTDLLSASSTGANPVDFEFRSDGTLISKGNYGVGNLLSSDKGAGSRLLWFPAQSAFRAGYVTGTQWDSPAPYSVALGYNTTAIGYATAMGYDTNAFAYSTAIGYCTNASGEYSTAMGYMSAATTYYATAMGGGIANGAFSISVGNGTVTNGYFSLATGNGTIANGNGSIAMGYCTIASAYCSMAL